MQKGDLNSPSLKNVNSQEERNSVFTSGYVNVLDMKIILELIYFSAQEQWIGEIAYFGSKG